MSTGRQALPCAKLPRGRYHWLRRGGRTHRSWLACFVGLFVRERARPARMVGRSIFEGERCCCEPAGGPAGRQALTETDPLTWRKGTNAGRAAVPLLPSVAKKGKSLFLSTNSAAAVRKASSSSSLRHGRRLGRRRLLACAWTTTMARSINADGTEGNPFGGPEEKPAERSARRNC